uniref:Reverse transcriptase domain-containing protein n=1 Tax=Tanacetum cinerariifolium TaxID=118510 RepID=A0A6L2L0D5_TANCI|nr:reverse transcriptase domain-containing protein [Tanacetum cinerariifolium]
MIHHSPRLTFLLRGHLQHLVHLTSSYDSYTKTTYPSWSIVALPSQWADTHDVREEEVGPLPTHLLIMIYLVDYSSLDHLSSDDSSRDSSSSSSSETSSNPSSDDLLNSLSKHSLPAPSSGIRPSHHLCSLVPSAPCISAAITNRLSYSFSSASPFRKKSRSPTASVPLYSPVPRALFSPRNDLLPSPKRIRSPKSATNLKGCSEDSFKPYVPREARLGVDVEDESFEPSRARGIDARVVVEAVDRDEVETGARAQTRRRVNEQIDCRMAEALGACDAARNLEPLMRYGGEHEEVNENRGNRNGGNRNRGNGKGGANGNGNGNGGGYGYNFGGFMPTRECTYQDFLKCQPLKFNKTKGVVGLTRWFEKMEMVFHINNYPEKYQVNYDACTLLNNALTWWNSYKRTIGIEAAYAMKWTKLIKLMTKVYCPRNEIQKMKTELWNLAVKGNDLTAYTRRFQELVILCTRMVPNEEDNVKRFVRGYTLRLLGHPFDIDLMPVKLGCFGVIIGMDWLVKYHAMIVCDEKVVPIPYGDEVLIICSDDCDGGGRSKLNIISCTKTQKYIERGCQVYLAQVTSKKTEDKLEDKRFEDMSIVQEFLKVFPEDLPRLPPARQVEFQIDLVLSAAPVARAPYRLAPAETQEFPLNCKNFMTEDL